MRHNDFVGFVDDYIDLGLFVGLIIACIVFAVGAAVFDSQIDGIEKKNQFYSAIKAEKLPKDESVKNESVWKAVSVIKTIVNKHQELDLKSLFKEMDKLQKLGEGFYSKFFFVNTQKIVDLIEGNLGLSKLLLKAPNWNWDNLFRQLVFLALAMLIICSTGHFAWESLIENRESLFDWPWRRWWVYPSIIFLSPALVPCMVIEAIVRFIIFFVVYLIIKPFNWLFLGSRQESETEKVWNLKIENRKVDARQMIEKAKNNLDDSRENWTIFYLKDIEVKTEELRNKMKEKKNQLSELGSTISVAQKEFAGSQKQLIKWEQNLERHKNKKREDYCKEFERILGLPNVAMIEVLDNQLCVYTDVIYVKHVKKTYEVGMLLIKIYMLNNGLEVFNFSNTRRSSDRSHPYGNARNICFGDMTSSLQRTLESKEYFAAIQYILKALQSAEGDAPARIRQWKEVKQYGL